ncbi:formyltetrahydrofolate deformylase [Rubellicoccus peritrichatus]|uniref:Formyltetrahydrofolate deformylase n=1 Tax=Rubellicoccus peritrichatus TaxID=3080537 RepID=A0AAQ3LGL0_9BACT|nr:formyltetrahydrofolate deformylase [Puniceicoccus sp. CR14]WOO41749.1 formyltetrahydrofolate deformylase [Puniceicoccus sp. CR14]
MQKQDSKPRIIALLSGPDRPGLVAKVAGWIYERGGNVFHADQHQDGQAGIFFQRVEWDSANDPKTEAAEFAAFANNELGMTTEVALSSDRPRVAIFVSKIEHCFHDTILRFKANELPGEIATVVSNHETLGNVTKQYGLPFHHVPVSAATKAEAEKRQIEIVKEAKADLVVMARYMQVLSDDFLKDVGCPVINIHHSFLPAFAGGKPYHQAYNRGVKIIGATAHYATADLDEGPIIAQDVSRVTHRHGPQDLVRRGKDLEKNVFAQAIRWHLEHRILVYNNKTVVFD